MCRCSHCRDLAPTWEKFAEVMHDAQEHIGLDKEDYDRTDKAAYEEAVELDYPVLVAKVDCVANHELCVEKGIDAFPTLILYVNGDDTLVRTMASLIELCSCIF
jgi:thiol-disulfide isomerase/thioredoxin